MSKTPETPKPPLLDKEGAGVVSKEAMSSCEYDDFGAVPLCFHFAGGWAFTTSSRKRQE